MFGVAPMNGKSTRAFDVRHHTVFHIAQANGANPAIAENRADLAVPHEADVLPRGELLDVVALRPQRAAANHDHAAAGLREHESLLDRTVTTTDDDDILVAKKSAITRRAPRDAAADEFLLAWDSQFAQRRTGGNDDCLGMISLVFLICQSETLVHVELCDTRLHDLNGRFACILQQMDRKILTGEFPGNRKAVDLADRGDESTEEPTRLEQRHQTPQTHGVPRSTKPGEATADDCDFTAVLERSHPGGSLGLI